MTTMKTIILLICFCTLGAFFCTNAPAQKKVIIDCDPGVDDAMALIMAMESEALEVVGITTCFGNVYADTATTNALRLVEMAGKNIPVAPGSARPWTMKQKKPPHFIHGKNGLGDIAVEPPKGKPVSKSAAQFIIEKVKSDSGNISLLVLGPMTNIALALKMEPRLPEYVKELVFMGGTVYAYGNVTPVAEANIYNDPHAADMVLTADWKMIMIGLDVTSKTILSDEILDKVKNNSKKYGAFIWNINQLYSKYYKKNVNKNGCHFHDPSAVAYLIDSTLFSFEQGPLRVATKGLAMGQTIIAKKLHYKNNGEWHHIPFAHVAVNVKSEAVLKLFLELVSE